MRTIPSTEFRRIYAKLVEPVAVVAGERLVGEFFPVGTNDTADQYDKALQTIVLLVRQRGGKVRITQKERIEVPRSLTVTHTVLDGDLVLQAE